jgi:hypothetical protein
MNWEAIGAVGEMVGAAAVVISLVMLTFQVRYSAQTTEESNRLERSAALDRHSDTISRWRGRLSADGELAGIWLTASKDGELGDVEEVRLNNLWIDLVNTQRSNFARARIVGETGLARQAVLSIAVEMGQSRRLRHQWESMRPWSELSSSEFASLVDAADVELRGMEDNPYRAGSRYHEFVS